MNSNENNESKVLDGEMLAKMAQGGAVLLRANAGEVNNLNVFPVPDGDTGDNMSMTIESGVSALKKVDTNNLADVMSAFSRGTLLGARGNSGVILSQFFAGMAKGLENCETADVDIVGKALQIGVAQAYKSVLTPTEGTILTVARESVEYAVSNIDSKSTIRSLFDDLSREMDASLRRTPMLLKALREASVVDSGGAGLLYIMKGFLQVLNGEEVNFPQEERVLPVAKVDFSSFGPDSIMEYGYCTEFLLQLQNGKVDVDSFDVSLVTDFLKTVGDSIVAFKTDSIVKVHVHTMTPEKVLGFCRQYGEFLTMKIENMSVQHNETLTEEEVGESKDDVSPVTDTVDEQRKKYGTVAVCSGEGIKAVFEELGTDYVINGGQTNNPSTNDFLAAFENVHAENIFVFPNNGNIIMAASQAAEMYAKANVYVIESKDLGSGYVALASMDFDAASAEDIKEGALSAMQTVKTGCISPAIRDADMNGVHVTNGDYIGFVGKEIVSSCESKVGAAAALLDKMFENTDKFMLTVFYGKSASESENEELQKIFEERHGDKEVYFLDGGQEIYEYIFIVE